MPASPFSPIRPSNEKIALVDAGKQHSYGDLNSRAEQFSAGLLGTNEDLNAERIAFIVPASLDYVTTLHGIWRAGGIAIPLSALSSVGELEHYLQTAGVTRLIANHEFHDAVRELCNALDVELLSVAEVLSAVPKTLPTVSHDRQAMILFTSGTTNKPKGVVITHRMITAQVMTLVDAWAWQDDDIIPLFLPLHHIHGIVNVLSCALHIGATIHLMPKLEIPELCDHVVADTFSVFMAVPTIYVKLIDYLERQDSHSAENICAAFGRMRLNVSGSAACPVNVFEKWQDLTGQVLLERYGMTEVGMAISNPYVGERRAGFVGQALPGVEVGLFDEDNRRIDKDATPGEIRMRGENVFQAYWDNPEATAASFKEGWFCSGDIAVVEQGYFRIMGRSSIDIIKSGGYKLSALEIEGVLLTHNDIREVAVIGLNDATWGESVAAVVSLRDGARMAYADLKQWCAGKMSTYKIPKSLSIMDNLPRNAMGKVVKPELKQSIQESIEKKQ